MKLMRHLLKDRLSVGAIAALIGYMLLLQGLVAGFSQGAMAASALDPLHVICASDGTISTAAKDPAGSPVDKAFQCPCATLCQLAATATPAVLGQLAVFAYAAPKDTNAVRFEQADVFQSVFRGLLAEARAPPLSM
ncbi:hypothetical protein D3Y55_04470 [Mesorhizobium sp. DCY119]|nr:hypothetical protein D3Y55_04470 [Mesorhizobium sp. DCY119]